MNNTFLTTVSNYVYFNTVHWNEIVFTNENTYRTFVIRLFFLNFWYGHSRIIVIIIFIVLLLFTPSKLDKFLKPPENITTVSVIPYRYLCAFSWWFGEENTLYVQNCLSITILVWFSSLLFVRLVREPVFDFPS